VFSDDYHSESAASRIQRSFRRSLLARPSNRSLEGGGPNSSVGAATAVAVGVCATTVVALGAGAVTVNHVSITPSTYLNEVGTESMDNDLEANNSPREASDNDGMSSDYPSDDVPDATETEYTDESDDLEASISPNNEDLETDKAADDLVNKPDVLRQIGWGAMKGAIILIGATMVKTLLSGGGSPIDEDDAIAAHTLMSGGGGGGGPGGNAGAAGTGGAQGASTTQ
jgi:hypothetical protein